MRKQPQEIEINEIDRKSIEVCCSVFGCGKILTMEEKLCGNKCEEHINYKGGLSYLKDYYFKMK